MVPLSALWLATGGTSSSVCSLNGDWSSSGDHCECDKGWKGETCAELDLLPAQPSAFGLRNLSAPTWGGSAVFDSDSQRWQLIVGARAQAMKHDSATDYPCDSRIIRAVSDGTDPAGPYTIAEVLFPRSSWEPSFAIGPVGELILMFYGNMSNPPPVGSPDCMIPSSVYNLTTTNTYITVSASGKASGPWARPRLVHGMENMPGSEPYSWRCASGNPSPAFHPNGTLYAAMRQNPCWKGFTTREHIGLWRADGGWDGRWTLVSEQPLFGWRGGQETNCTDKNDCPSNEDPHLWIDKRGFHLLVHDQNNRKIHSVRGAYGWSVDGLRWVLETPPASTASAWDMDLRWVNGTSSALARRQRVSFVRSPTSGRPTHIINGADFRNHLSQPGGCEGCHWGQGFSLIQPLNVTWLETKIL